MVKKSRRFDLKKILKTVWDEFVYGSHLLALGDTLAIIALSIILEIQITWALPLVIYLSVLAINSYNRYEEYDTDILTNPERSEKMRKYIRFFPYLISLLLVVATIIVSQTATMQSLIFMGLLFILGLLYTLIFKGWTKKVIGFKNFSIALPYSLMVIFTALYYGHPITGVVILIMIFYYIRIFMSAMYFDIKDIRGDKKEGLKTFAVVFGKDKTINILQWLNIISFIPILVGLYYNLIPFYSVALFLTIPYANYYLSKTSSKSINLSFLNNVIADGEFIFWLPYILIAKMVFL